MYFYSTIHTIINAQSLIISVIVSANKFMQLFILKYCSVRASHVKPTDRVVEPVATKNKFPASRRRNGMDISWFENPCCPASERFWRSAKHSVQSLVWIKYSLHGRNLHLPKIRARLLQFEGEMGITVNRLQVGGLHHERLGNGKCELCEGLVAWQPLLNGEREEEG